jgi:hypothetical protein
VNYAAFSTNQSSPGPMQRCKLFGFIRCMGQIRIRADIAEIYQKDLLTMVKNKLSRGHLVQIHLKVKCNWRFITFGNANKAMKKKLSTIGILFMLVLKHPPLPEFSLFQKHYIVEVRCFSLKKIALEFFMN